MLSSFTGDHSPVDIQDQQQNSDHLHHGTAHGKELNSAAVEFVPSTGMSCSTLAWKAQLVSCASCMAMVLEITMQVHEHDLQADHCQSQHASLLGNRARLM